MVWRKMEITQEKLRQIIIRVLSKYQKPNNDNTEIAEKPVDRAGAYVLCEEGKEDAFLSFLRVNKASGNLDVIAVLENPNGDLIKVLLEEGLCKSIASPRAKSDQNVKLTVYPTFSRKALCEAGLCMDGCFSSAFLRADFEEGRESCVLMKGLDPFTGKEPEHYKNKILGYIREMALMKVRFVRSAEDVFCCGSGSNGTSVNSVKKEESVKSPAKDKGTFSAGKIQDGCYTLNTVNNIVSARDLKQFPVGSKIYLADKKIITPLAKDVIRDLKLTIISA